MNFNLFGIDIISAERLFGFWVFNIKIIENQRSLFGIYYSDGELYVDIFFIRFQLR